MDAETKEPGGAAPVSSLRSTNGPTLPSLGEPLQLIRPINAQGRHPQPAGRDAISDATGFARSTRDRYIQFLQARKLVTSDNAGVKASDELFD